MDYSKYFKPKSVTWWVGIAQVAAGVALAVFGNVDALTTAYAILNDLVGSMTPYQLIFMGMGLIGLRGAL